MAFTGGDCIEITVAHPILGAFRFEPKAAEDTEVNEGGFMKNDDDQSITGAGVDIIIVNRKRWSVTTPPIGWDEDPNTLEELQSLIDDPNPSDWTFSFIDGSVYRGRGTIVGDLMANKNAASINSFKVAGGGKLEKIA